MPEVLTYSIEILKALLVGKSEASAASIESRFHWRYFNEYFAHQDIDAKSIVVQDDYIDRDYLEDYASYYVRCFHHYKSHCCRLHFFNRDLSAEEVQQLIIDEPTTLTAEELQQAYIGFIVVRPLPMTVIGRTCLKTYGDDGGRRKYPITCRNSVSFFGIPLYVTSLGFQEQDTVAGACATSALWTILQGTGRTFQHAIPSPAGISNLADHQQRREARRAPSRGLNQQQAQNVIRAVDLEPLNVNVGDRFSFQSNVYAYLRGNIPLFLGLQVLSVPGPLGQHVDVEQAAPYGFHAVAITGLSIGPAPAGRGIEFSLRAAQVDKVYAHDDQVGPFAKMEIRDLVLRRDGNDDKTIVALTTSSKASKAGHVLVAVPDALIVPLYHKIRIPYSYVQGAVLSFDKAMKALLATLPLGFELDQFMWDISLVTGTEYLDYQRKRKDILGAHRLALATMSLPRFYWQASLYYQDRPAMTILFDATDLEQGDVVVHIIEENEHFCTAARVLARDATTKQRRELLPDWRIWKWLRSHESPQGPV